MGLKNDEEFQQALQKVSKASKRMHTFFSRRGVWTKEDMEEYQQVEEEFNKANERFKDFIEDKTGIRHETTGFE